MIHGRTESYAVDDSHIIADGSDFFRASLALFAAIAISNRNYNERNFNILKYNEKKIEDLKESMHEFIAECRTVESKVKRIDFSRVNEIKSIKDAMSPMISSVISKKPINVEEGDLSWKLFNEVNDSVSVLNIKKENVIKNIPLPMAEGVNSSFVSVKKFVVKDSHKKAKFLANVFNFMSWFFIPLYSARVVITEDGYKIISKALERALSVNKECYQNESENIDRAMMKCISALNKNLDDGFKKDESLVVELEGNYTSMKYSYSNIEDSYIKVLLEKIKSNRRQEYVLSIFGFLSIMILIFVLSSLGLINVAGKDHIMSTNVEEVAQ